MINVNKIMEKDIDYSKKSFKMDIGSKTILNFPKYLIRPSDNCKFIHVKDGFYTVESTLTQWPDHLHHYYPYDFLKKFDFYEKT